VGHEKAGSHACSPVGYGIGLTAIFAIAGAIPPFSFFSSVEHYLPLHTVLEFASITVALMVFALAWHLRDQTNQRYAILGVGFLCVALIDFGHMLSYPGMPDLVTPSGAEKAIAFWLAARLITAITLLGAAFVPGRHCQRRYLHLGIGVSLLTAAATYWLILAHQDQLPATFVPGKGLTPFKIWSEYLFVGLFAIAAIRLLRKTPSAERTNLAWLGLAAWTMGLAELFFTLYGTVTDTHNLLGHIYKVLASLTIYRAIFVTGVREPAYRAAKLTHRLESLIDATRSGTWMVDLDTRRMEINQRWAQMLGYDWAALSPFTETDWRNLVHPDDLPAVLHRLAEARRTPPHEFRIEYRMRHQDGHWVWLLAMGSYTPDTGRPGRRASGVNVDISERKTRELEIATQRRRLNDILEGTHVGTWEWQVQTGETIFNERWAQILGYTLAELAPVSIDTWRRLAHPDDLAHSDDVLRKHFAGELDYYACETRMRHRDGHWVWVLGRGKVSQWDNGGLPMLMSGTHQDISERKAMEEELRTHREHLEHLVAARTRDLKEAKDAAESASRAKTTFLSLASHELRTPMNGIMGSLALALRKTQEPQVIEYLTKADRASKQLLNIINDVLDISRIESNRLTLASVRFTLEEILSHVHDALDGTAHLKGLILRSEVSAPLAIRGYLGDPTRITQILMNLVGNALKFTSRGEVLIRVTDLPDARGGIRLRFKVIDNGIGIEPKDQARIFEQFEQVDSSDTRQYGGAGLGLPLCKRLAEAMGGHIGVISELGHGSTFWFDIITELVDAPEQLAAVTQPDAEKFLREQRTGASVLLAEDEPFNQEIIGEMLDEVKLNVQLARNGKEAVAMAQNEEFDIILMDLNMPHMGGIDATRAIRQIPAYAHTPILALTANAFVEDRDACLHAGMNDHIGKPVTPEVLFASLARWLQ